VSPNDKAILHSRKPGDGHGVWVVLCIQVSATILIFGAVQRHCLPPQSSAARVLKGAGGSPLATLS
jgi:hypothetical protein